MTFLLKDIRAFGKVDDVLDVAEGKTGDGVGAAIVDGDAAGSRVVQVCAGETYAGNISYKLVQGLGSNKVLSATGNYLPGLLAVKQGAAKGINVAVARAKHAVVDEQPAL